MKQTILICAGTALGMIAFGALAAAKHPAEKGPPACSALTFRAVAAGAGDGDQQAGFYRSRYGTLALHADVKGGQPTDYFVLADGKKLNAALRLRCPIGRRTARWRKSCQSPRPPALRRAPGQRFRVVLAHDANERLALLYGFDGSAWHFCSAGSY